jgi:hypothetical protein
MILRREFELNGGGLEGPVGRYVMSESSKILLEHGFDYWVIAEKRIQNYQILLAIQGAGRRV